MERMEDLRQVRELQLMRDERDQTEALWGGDMARRVTLLVSQLLSAVCVLVDNPAVFLLLSLTFVSGAAGNLSRYIRDRGRVHLAAGAAAAAASALLWAAFFLQPHYANFPFVRLVVYGGLCSLLTTLAGLVFLGLLLGTFWIKGRAAHMDGARWERYFETVSTAGLLLRGGVLALIALGLTAAGGGILFSWLDFPHPALLAMLFLIAGGAGLLRKLGDQREMIVKKLLRLKTHREA